MFDITPPPPLTPPEAIERLRAFILRKTPNNGERVHMLAACDALASDPLTWLESKLGLHTGVDLLYVVDGYEVEVSDHDGGNIVCRGRGSTLRAAIEQAMRAAP